MDELKPCPLCESKDVNPIEAYIDEGLVRITCNECGFTTGAESDEETATAAWNTLFMMTAALRAELAELKAKWASVPWDAMGVCAEYAWRTLQDGDPGLSLAADLRVYVLNNDTKP